MMRLSSALVLNAPAGSGSLDEDIVKRVMGAIADQAIYDYGWLAEGEAWQALMSIDEDEDTRRLRRRVESQLSEFGLDINIVPDDLHFRKRKLLVADMESTIIEQELIDELADYVGLRNEISEITARAMRGELEFEGALRERVALLAGLDASILDEVYEQRVTLMPGAETLIKTMKANGAYCALVSGGFTVFTERIAARLGFDEHQANVLEIENGKLTGRVKEPILGRQAKRAALERIAAARRLNWVDTIAVGDGANDLDMLSAAGLGVAFRAKPKIREAALDCDTGAVVTHGDLRALLYLQGYRKVDFKV
jgi:phosphoserine phosphatase